ASGQVGRYEVDRRGAGIHNNGTSRTHDWAAQYPTTREARVRACNAAGCSSWTAYRSAQPNDQRVARISWGGSANNEPGCTSNDCTCVKLNGRTCPPTTTRHAVCQEWRNGRWEQFAGTSGWSFTTNGSGDGTRNTLCWYGYNSKMRAKVTYGNQVKYSNEL